MFLAQHRPKDIDGSIPADPTGIATAILMAVSLLTAGWRRRIAAQYGRGMKIGRSVGDSGAFGGITNLSLVGTGGKAGLDAPPSRHWVWKVELSCCL